MHHESHSDLSRARRRDRRSRSVAALDDATFAAIERAYNEYGVIFCRGQSITPAQQVAFTRRFGDIEIPELHGLPLGDTEFASAAAAWDALPDAMKRTLEGRRAVFEFRGRKRSFPPTQAEIDRNPLVRHPIVRTHPSTGRRCLYVMRDDCTGIEGMEPDEAEALIAALADHIVKPAFVYRHQWRRGDVLLWDNCMVQHRAIQDYDMPQRRLMHRTTMGGAIPA